MLVLSRRTDESVVIQPAEGVDGNITLAQLFANGPIQIILLGAPGRRAKIGIVAPEQLAIRRQDTI
jgi:sRNA-binding carbon storage regulator CsrA